MRIEVTREDIRYGIPHNECMCPIAQALNRVMPEVDFLVGKNVIYQVIGPEDIEGVIPTKLLGALPRAAQEFVSQFDQGEQVEPFEFDMEVR